MALDSGRAVHSPIEQQVLDQELVRQKAGELNVLTLLRSPLWLLQQNHHHVYREQPVYHLQTPEHQTVHRGIPLIGDNAAISSPPSEVPVFATSYLCASGQVRQPLDEAGVVFTFHLRRQYAHGLGSMASKLTLLHHLRIHGRNVTSQLSECFS